MVLVAIVVGSAGEKCGSIKTIILEFPLRPNSKSNMVKDEI